MFGFQMDSEFECSEFEPRLYSNSILSSNTNAEIQYNSGSKINQSSIRIGLKYCSDIQAMT